jgi:regulator of protease activity HflC (stomatin/prohibitin superfamily)
VKPYIIGGLVLLGLILLGSSVYTLDETEQAIITQFGEPVGQAHLDPGLHMKIPFIQDEAVARMERRSEPDSHARQEVHLGRQLHALAREGPPAVLPAGA